MQNKFPREMVNDYAQELTRLENLFYDFYGYVPTFDTKEFWEDKAVKRIETLLMLWTDLHNKLSWRIEYESE